MANQSNSSDRPKLSLWMKRVAKSFGYVGLDQITQMMPGLTDTVRSAKDTFADVREKFDDTKSYSGIHKIKSFVDIDTDAYIEKVKKLKDNVIEDLRTGNLNNTARQDAAMNLGGDDDFDLGADFDFDDSFDTGLGDDSGDQSETGDNDTNVIVPDVNVHTNINSNNPMVQVMERTNNNIIKTSEAAEIRDQAIASANMELLQGVATGINNSLGTINSNIAMIVDFNKESTSSLISSTLSYHEASLSTMGAILIELKKVSTGPEKQYSLDSYDSSTDIFGYSGEFDVGRYIEHVIKNAKSYVSNSMIGSMIGTMTMGVGNTSMLDTMMANPLGLAIDLLVGKLIPTSVRNTADKLDKTLTSFIPAIIGKLTGMGDSYDMSFAGQVKQAIGSIFGFEAKIKRGVSVNDYERGPIPFDGITKKAVTEVIPGYLSRILATLSDTNPITYDYTSGTFQDVFKMRDKFYQDSRYDIISAYDDFDRVKDAIRDEFEDSVADEIIKKTEDALIKASTITGVIDPSKTANDGNNFDKHTLEDLFNASSSGINPLIVSNELTEDQLKRVRDIFMDDNVLTPAMRMKMFAGADKFSAMEALSEKYRYAESNEPTLRAVLGNKLYDNVERKETTEEDERTRTRLTDYDLNDIDSRRTRLLQDIEFKHLEKIPGKFSDIPMDDEIREALNKQKKYNEERRKKGLSMFGSDANFLQRAMEKVLSPVITPVVTAVDSGLDKLSARVHDFVFDIRRDPPTDDSNNGGDNPNPPADIDDINPDNPQGDTDDSRPRADIDTNDGNNSDINADDSRPRADIDNNDGNNDNSGDGPNPPNPPPDDRNGNIFDRTLNSLHDGVVSTFNNFAEYIKNKLFGDAGFFTQIKESELYKGIVEKKNHAKELIKTFLFGDGTTTGILSDFVTGAKHALGSVKEFFTGEDGVFAHAKSNVLAFKESFEESIYTPEKLESVRERRRTIKESESPVSTAIDMGIADIKDGFSKLKNRLFGPETNEDGTENTTRKLVTKITEHIKDNGVDALGKGVVGGGLATLITSLSPGLIPSLILNPVGVAAATIGGSLLLKSEKVSNFLFGTELDGEKVGGIISDKTQRWFKDNKKTLGLGAGIGFGAGGLITALGGASLLGTIPTYLLGGPLFGAVMGTATALVMKSGKMQDLLFGEMVDGQRVGGALKSLQSVMTKTNEETGLTPLHRLAGVGIGGATGLGLFTALSLNPVLGAMVGLGVGIKASGTKWYQGLFGKSDDPNAKSTLTETLTDKLSHIFDPIAVGFKKMGVYTSNWFDRTIKEPFIHTADYMFEGLKGMFTHGRVESPIVRWLRENVAEPIKESVLGKAFTKYVAEPITTAINFLGEKIKAVGNTLFKGVMKFSAGLLKLTGAMAMELVTVPGRMLGAGIRKVSSAFIDEDTRKKLEERHEARLSANKEKKKERKRQVSEFQQSLNQTSVINRFINASGSPENPNETRAERRARKKQEKAAAKEARAALVGKYGKDYNNLSSVDRARIDTEEAQAQDVFTIKDILQKMYEFFLTKDEEEQNEDIETDDNNDTQTDAEITNDANNGSDNKEQPEAVIADASTPSGTVDSDNTRNDTESNQPKAEIIPVDTQTDESPKPVDAEISDSTVEVQDIQSEGETPKKHPLISRIFGFGRKNKDTDEAEIDNDDTVGTKVNMDGSVDESSLEADVNPAVAETRKGVGEGIINALSGKGSPIAPLFGALKHVGTVFAPLAAKGALLGIAALGIIRLFTDPAGFFHDVLDLGATLLKGAFGPLFNYLDSKGFSDHYKSEKISDSAGDLVDAVYTTPEGLADAEAIGLLKERLDESIRINDEISARTLGDRFKFGDVGNTQMNDYHVKKRNATNKKLAEAVLDGYMNGTINLSEEERKKYEHWTTLKDKDTTITFGDKFSNFFDGSLSDFVGLNTFGNAATSISEIGTWLNSGDERKREQEIIDRYADTAEDGHLGKSHHRAIGEPNVDSNANYYLHSGEGVLTSRANHLNGSVDTTANMINAFVRQKPNATVNEVVGALTSTTPQTQPIHSNIDTPSIPDELINTIYSPQDDYRGLISYANTLKHDKISATDPDYWKYDESNSDKYGGLARAVFTAIRSANFPSRLISDTLKESSEDMAEVEENVSVEKKSSFGSKIKSAITGAFNKVKGWFSVGGGEEEDAYYDDSGVYYEDNMAYGDGGDDTRSYGRVASKTKMSNTSTSKSSKKQKIDMGMNASTYYKFPSATIPLSDASKARTTSFGTKPHRGVDLLVRNRSNPLIKSMTGGSVIFAGRSNPDLSKSYGNMVQVQDENGMYHLYGHLKSLNVQTGQRITQGSVLGEEGTTGQSSGNHLHYEVGTGINVGKRLTGEVHPAEYMDGYNAGKKIIRATPIEKYDSGSYWNSGGTTDSTNSIELDTTNTVDNVAESQAEFEAVAEMTPEEEIQSRLNNGEDILSIMYSPFAALTSVMKSIVKGTPTNASEDIHSTGSSSGATTTSKLKGSDDAERIWNYLTTKAGFTKQGAAGIMGNMRAESGLQSNNLENQYNQSTGMSDAEYTKAVDNGSYSGSKFGNDRYGYGLVQWTSEGRKPGLYKLAKERNVSISDLGMQLDYMREEMENGYPNLVKLAKSPSASLYDVSTEMVKRYEIPAGYNLKSTHDKRAALGQEVYNTYAYGGGEDTTSAEVTSHSYTTHTPQRISPTPSNPTATSGSGVRVVSMLTDVITYLAQIATNTKSGSSSLSNIEAQNKKILATAQTNNNNTPVSPQNDPQITNNPMFDIAQSARQRRNEYTPSQTNYTQAKAIARGF